MKIFDAAETEKALPFLTLVNRMEALFAHQIDAPDRHHHTLRMQDEPDATLLLMPAWDQTIGCVKIVNVVPGNNARDLPSISGNVLVFDRAQGTHLAILDGAVLTARRTAAASALGARYLAQPDAQRLLIVGAGRVAAQLAGAFTAVLPSISEVRIWDIRLESANRLAQTLCGKGFNATATDNLEDAISTAHIISCATLATKPLLKGEWLRPGQHLDLIGAFTPEMREADDEALRRARIFVDTNFAMAEAGELKIPLETGAISIGDILGDLRGLCSGIPARETADDITVFKSVGNAVMDLAAASVAMGGERF